LIDSYIQAQQYSFLVGGLVAVGVDCGYAAAAVRQLLMRLRQTTKQQKQKPENSSWHYRYVMYDLWSRRIASLSGHMAMDGL
jgi:hypothetical protein